MTDTTPTQAVWFVTGAARGMGIELAKAALEAGHRVVGTARDAAKVTAAIGEHDYLLAVSLDVTDVAAAKAAVDAAVRAHRHLGQQRRQLLRRVLRGDQ